MADFAEVPTDTGRHLRACIRCCLLKTYDQFLQNGCENCPFFQMEGDEQRVQDATTSNFSGMIGCLDPKRSWSARWLRISNAVPGTYALSVSGDLPEDLIASCEEAGVKYFPKSYQ